MEYTLVFALLIVLIRYIPLLQFEPITEITGSLTQQSQHGESDLTQETGIRILAGEPYFHIIRYILLLHVNLLCSFDITGHYSDPI